MPRRRVNGAQYQADVREDQSVGNQRRPLRVELMQDTADIAPGRP